MNPVDSNLKSVCAIIVTYADRANYVLQVAQALISQEVMKIVIVSNGSSDKSLEIIREFAGNNELIELIVLPENKGSAGGFSIGFQKAYEYQDIKYLLAVDDDNLPGPGALDMLEQNLVQLGKENSAVVGLRQGREPYQAVADGNSAYDSFPHVDSFYSFDLFRKLRKVMGVKNPSIKKSDHLIPYAPYGGLFLRRSILRTIGFPDEKFVLYSDDHDFTYRITSNKGDIKLVSEARFFDLEVSWNIKNKSAFQSFFEASSNQIYFSVRNTAYFEKKYLVSNPYRYYTNMLVFIFFIVIYALKNRDLKRLALFMKALADGSKSNFSRSNLYLEKE